MSKEEFGKLYLEQRKRLVRLVYRWGATPEEANELVQDSFEALWQKILNGDHLDSPLAFLLTVCRNKTLNLLTSSYRSKRVIGKDPSDDDEDFTRGGYEGELGDAGLRDDCVRRRLHEFEADYPDAAYVVRMQLQGLPIIKIAEAISRTLEATKQYIYQCKKKIRPYLEECKD
ncbi:RpoE DNA-directed RNA polymerase specialized sigma subunit, sigma24 homolog [Burkholderiales bacterium]